MIRSGQDSLTAPLHQPDRTSAAPGSSRPGVGVSCRQSRSWPAQHSVLAIEVEPVDLVDGADHVSAGESGRKLERGHIHAWDVRWTTAVAAELLHERGPVHLHLLPHLPGFPGIAIDQLRSLVPSSSATCATPRGIGLAVGLHRPGDQQASGTGRTGTRRAYTNPRLSSGRKTAGPYWSTCGTPGHQRDSARRASPRPGGPRKSRPPGRASHAANLGQPRSDPAIRPGTGQHGLEVRQPVQRREPVDSVDDQGPLQFRAPHDEAGERPLVATWFMARGACGVPELGHQS